LTRNYLSQNSTTTLTITLGLHYQYQCLPRLDAPATISAPAHPRPLDAQ
jgi:hypothetical protein